VIIQFLKDHIMRDGKLRRKGEVLVVPENMAGELMQAGVVKERPPVGPTERKETA
jgi:hypothetical protein